VIEDEMARRLHSDFVLIYELRSITRRRLVETENPSACAKMNCKLCKSAIALYLNVIKRTCNRRANKSNHPELEPVIFVTDTTLGVTIY
jgi:hypothetical protein